MAVLVIFASEVSYAAAILMALGFAAYVLVSARIFGRPATAPAS